MKTYTAKRFFSIVFVSIAVIFYQNCTKGDFNVQSGVVSLNSESEDPASNDSLNDDNSSPPDSAPAPVLPPVTMPPVTVPPDTRPPVVVVDVEKEGLLKISDLSYVGAFRAPGSLSASSVGSMEGAVGRIALGANNSSLFITSHPYQQAIAEINIPELVNSTNLANLRTATYKQDFSTVLGRPLGGNPQGMDEIGGMAYVNGKLLVNTYVYYNATGGATHTTMVFNDASKLQTSVVSGYHGFTARAHASGWISDIPPEWQTELGGTHITGFSSGVPIISRLSVGPSAFVFNANASQLTGTSSYTIPSTTLLDYSLDHIMGLSAGGDSGAYLYNSNKTNKLWTHMASAVYGFIVPGTSTYMVIGNQAGVNGGICYKGQVGCASDCGGYCTLVANDHHNYYWLFDMADLTKVQKGQIPSYSVMPYAYGPMAIPFSLNGSFAIGGASYDASKKLLYISVRLPYNSVEFNRPPVIVALKVK